MGNARGWGTGRGNEGLIPQRPATPEDAVDYLKEIRDRYVQPGTLDTRPFDLGANEGLRINMTPAPVNALLITVISGTIFGYFGDYSSQFNRAPAIPHFSVSAGVVPTTVQIAIPPGNEYIICVQEPNGATATGCITPMAL